MGPTGEAVARNLKRLRGSLTLRELQRKLRDVGHEISASGLQKIEAGARRVDVDDLMALAIALGVNPNAVLLPWSSDEPLEVTGAKVGDLVLMWDWAEGESPIEGNRQGLDPNYDRKIRPAGVGSRVPSSDAPISDEFNLRLAAIGEDIKALMEQVGIEGRSADGND
ncbi:hypothetical protein SRABI83_03744 [Arthrobacter sp. Bi83]|nr:hypothetical protein SRABI83_03744 [Arthrobacter sp. Bi83]